MEIYSGRHGKDLKTKKKSKHQTHPLAMIK